MTLVDFSTNAVHMDVLCANTYLNYVLAGIGNNLFVYSNHVLKLTKQIFINERIHKIYVKNDWILLKGGKQLALVSLCKSFETVSCHVISLIQSSDWIQDVIKINGDTIGLTSAHNLFQFWNMTLGKHLLNSSCKEKCILYSCKIIGNSSEDILVFSGTVFGDILVWSPSNEKECEPKRIKGHNGAVFSMEVDTKQKILSTTSDDRSLKIWSIKIKESIFDIKNWENSEIQLIHTLYGHTGRVWKSLIISDFYVTIGEDSKLIIWAKDGKLIKSLSLHQESGIRALHKSKETDEIITGGEDGGINIIHWKNFIPNDLCVPGKSITTGQNFSSRVRFVKNGFAYTSDGCVMLASGDSEEVIYKSEDFKSYCILEVSALGEYIFLGSIRGHLVVIDVERKAVVEEQVLGGRVYSIHWLNGFLLTTVPNGKVILWEFKEKTVKSTMEMELPNCKERWTTCGAIFKDKVILGDRMGNIHVYILNGGENPIRSFRKIHSYLGVTDLMIVDDVLLSIGRDGTVKIFTEQLVHSETYKLPFEWPWKIINQNSETLILGFCSSFFIVWSLKHKEVIASHDCGGGHRSCDYKLYGNSLNFVYLKEKKVFLINLLLNNIIRLRNGFHSREINCLRVIQFPGVIVTGSEDTTMRISRVQNGEIEETQVLKTHISSVRAVGVCPMSPNTFLIVSAGGRAQIIVWIFDVNTLKCREMVNHHLRKETRNWKCPTPIIDPETRFMCVCVTKLASEFLIATGCSDCKIRMFTYSSDSSELNHLCTIPYTHCLLNIGILKIQNSFYVISMGTDGLVNLWDIFSTDGVHNVGAFSLHQSGINSFHLSELESGKFILGTGGDDNMICLSLLQITRNGVCFNKLWSNSTTHSCQVTGLKILKDILLTTSVDQRITAWKWSLEENAVNVEFINQYVTTVPDIQGMEANWLDDTTILVFVHGKGIESIKVNVSSAIQV